MFLVSVEDWSGQGMDVLSAALAREQIGGHSMASSQLAHQQIGQTLNLLYKAFAKAKLLRSLLDLIF